MSSVPILANGVPRSSLFEVRETKCGSGRGVYAVRNIPAGTVLLGTSTIVSRVIYHEYIKEVCAQCFAYDRGKAWKIRSQAMGLVFCSNYCAQEWADTTRQDVHQARCQLHQALGKKKGTSSTESASDSDQYPGVDEINVAWHKAEASARIIRKGRTASLHTKESRRAVEAAKAVRVDDAATLWYLFEGCVQIATDPQAWSSLKLLVAEERPYKSRELAEHIQAYLFMLAIIPLSLLPQVTMEVVRTIQSHSIHNVFGIRSLGEGGREGDAGSEFLGYGLWPAASFWNHSCEPNIQKRRRGKTWTFHAARAVEQGEELCITYLGGDERDLTTVERKAKLKDGWGFDCACTTCSSASCA